MKKNYTNSFILNTINLPKIENLNDFSSKIALSKTLIYLLSRKNKDNFYHRFEIDKKDGSKREILAPSYSLKIVQRWVLENILYKLGTSDVCFAFKRNIGPGIKRNAEMHKYNLYILEIDLKDFFTSIKKEKVFYFFKGIGYNNYISNLLTGICTYNDYLPQGAVTSPYLSNLLCYKMDIRIKKYCSKRDIVYSRYADDLTFSCDNKNNLKKIYPMIKKIVEDEGFKINNKKTRYLSPNSRKRVTGINVNDNKIKVPKELKRKVRSMIHRAITSTDYSNIKTIKGYVSYINSIEDGYKNKIIKYINSFQKKDIKHLDDFINNYNGKCISQIT